MSRTKLSLFTFLLLSFSFINVSAQVFPVRGNDVATNTSGFTKEQLAEFNKLSPEQKSLFFKPPEPVLPEGTVSCLKYAPFNAISVEVMPVFNTLQPGTEATFTGKVINPFNYPIVEGQVFVKVFYKNTKTQENEHLNGYSLVDQFIAVDNLNLKAKDKHNISFKWSVPKYSRAGDYQVAFYFSSARQYNLTGLTFTNDITGNKTSFSIKATSTESTVYLDENSVRLNGTNFYFAQPNPSFAKDKKVTSYVRIVNPKDTDASVEVTYKLYAWDSLRSDNFRNQKVQTVTLKARESKTLEYEIPFIDKAVSYLVVEAKDKDAKSILNIRFGRYGFNEARNNRLEMFTYPIKANATSTLFACAHSTGYNNVDDSVITLTLKDLSGKVLHSYSYSKGITSNVMGLKEDFVISKDLYDFTLTSSVTQEGKPPEEITIKYNCSDIDPSICPIKSAGNGYGYLALFIFGIVAIGAFVLIRKKNETPNSVIV